MLPLAINTCNDCVNHTELWDSPLLPLDSGFCLLCPMDTPGFSCWLEWCQMPASTWWGHWLLFKMTRWDGSLSFISFLKPFVPIAVIIDTSITESDHGPMQKCMCCWDQTHLKQEAWIDKPSSRWFEENSYLAGGRLNKCVETQSYMPRKKQIWVSLTMSKMQKAGMLQTVEGQTDDF